MSSGSPRCCSARSIRAAGSTSWRASRPRRPPARWPRTASPCSRACRRCTPACWRSPRRRGRPVAAPHAALHLDRRRAARPRAQAADRGDVGAAAAQRLRPDRDLGCGLADRRSTARPATTAAARRCRTSRSGSRRPTALPCAPGEVGEILVRARSVMRGYYRDPALTAATVTPERLAQDRRSRPPRPDGRALRRRPPEGADHPLGLQRLPARGRGGADRASRRRALRGPRPPGRRQRGGRGLRPAGARPHALAPRSRAFVEQRLAPYKRPAEYRVMAELPATATGKLLKAQAQGAALARAISSRPAPPP